MVKTFVLVYLCCKSTKFLHYRLFNLFHFVFCMFQTFPSVPPEGLKRAYKAPYWEDTKRKAASDILIQDDRYD